MKATKKKTKGQMERHIFNAVLIVPKTRDTQSVYFDDKGLRLTVTDDFAVIETNFHRHVFSNITAQGVSRPYLYTKRFVEIALANDCMIRDARENLTRSYTLLMNTLKEKEDKTEYYIAWYCDLWFFNIFAPLFDIGESGIEQFLTYEQYMHTIARNSVLMEERKEDVTNKQFVGKVTSLEQSFIEGIVESVIIEKQTDEEKMQAEIAALQEMEVEENLAQQPQPQQEESDGK